MTDRYNVVALGPPLSGKTVYLAALHHVLTSASGEFVPGVHFTLGVGDNARLRSLFDEVRDTSQPFPESTRLGVSHEATFNCTVKRTRRQLFREPKRDSYPLIDLTYVDYSGEWLGNEAHLQDFDLLSDFEAKISRADALLALLDGVAVANAYSNPAEADRFHDRLQPILLQLNRCDVPTVFVLTKWDVVKRNVSLPQVASWLTSTNGLLGTFLQERSHRSVIRRRPTGGVRLVPVSAVGDGFAKSENGAMTKRPGATAHPENVELPVAAAIIDVARRAIAENSTGTTGAAEGQAALCDGPSLLDDLTDDVDRLNDLKLSSVFALAAKSSFTTSIHVARAARGPATALLIAIRRSIRKYRARKLSGVGSFEGAMLYLISAMDRAVTDFERSSEYEGSVLWKTSQEQVTQATS